MWASRGTDSWPAPASENGEDGDEGGLVPLAYSASGLKPSKDKEQSLCRIRGAGSLMSGEEGFREKNE